jgi:predicted nuclease with RNAse H fold
MPARPVITVGVDLAAQPKNTAAAVLRWESGQVLVESVRVNQTDADLVGVASGARMIGIDSPLGWPDAFVDFVAAQRDGRPVADLVADKRSLTLRATDHFVHSQFGLRPLSVSADLIGHVAIRAVGLLEQLAAADVAVDRSGVSGRVAETYPAGAVRQWLPKFVRYKGKDSSAVRSEMLTAIGTTLGLSYADAADADKCIEVDHAFDALLCALVSRALLLKQTKPPPARLRAIAQREGWIVVPTGSLADLSI